MIPQDIVGISHSGIVSKAVTGDNDFRRGIFRHLFNVLRLHILGQTHQQQAVIAHAIACGVVFQLYRLGQVLDESEFA